MFWDHLIEFLTLVTITIQLRTYKFFEPIVMYNLRDFCMVQLSANCAENLYTCAANYLASFGSI